MSHADTGAETGVSTDEDTLSNRSEFVLLYDAADCNPNGNPLSANDKPRVDETTGEAVVTDVRLKRYIRDQLYDDGHGVYVLNPSKADQQDSFERDDLFLSTAGLDQDELGDHDGGVIADRFLANAADVRYFGATCSFSSDIQSDLGDGFPGQFTGPVQFEHGRSMHTVVTKTESKQLSTVIRTDDSDQGTFATDNRLEYALVRFHGVANENGAATTGLTTADVRRLDSLIWRSLKNQTLTRSKAGHHPQLYLRVEYDADGYYHGGLDDLIERTDTAETDGSEYRAITDVSLTVDPLLERLAADADRDRIEAVHVVASDRIAFEPAGRDTDGPSVDGGAEALYDGLQTAVGETAVDVVDPYTDGDR